MNHVIKKFLVDEGFLLPDSEMDYNFDEQESYIYHVRNHLNDLITIKVVHNGLGSDEFNGQVKARNCFPQLVPEPIKYSKLGNQEFLFLECVPHHNFHVSHIYPQRLVWSRDLPDFLFGKAEALLDDDRRAENDYEKTLEMVRDDLPGHIYRMSKKMLATTDLNKYMELPVRAQHGDFSVNNLGVREGRLVIFDWENFGISFTYGLDFSVFVASAMGHDAELIMEYFKGNGHHSIEQLRQSLMKNCAFSDADLIPLFLMCYTIFFSMKKKHGYADEIINRIGSVLGTLYSNYGYT